MEKLIIAGKAKKVFKLVEDIARRHPDMPLSLYNGEDLKEFQFSIDVAEEIANEFSEEDIEQFIQKNIETQTTLIKGGKIAMLKVYGVLCGRCVGCQWGGTLESGKYMTSCKILATEVENTDDPADQCEAFVADFTDEQKVYVES